MSKTKIVLADGLSVTAVEFATEVSTNLGTRGGGKSNGAAVVVEQLIDAKVPVVILDYVGIWPSLRLSRDGKTPSRFQIPVLGGKHGDVTLVATGGAMVAEALAETNSSAIIDLSQFRKGERCQFATDFAEAFFQSKKRHPGPVLLVLEEAQRYIPQRIISGQERMLGAFEEIAETGRNFGVGMLLISLRPQKLNKDVLNLADWLFAYRTNGVLERKALAEWVQEKGAEGRNEMAGELPGLPKGTAIVWCPVRGIYGRFKMPLKETYDASATPTEIRDAVHIKPLDLGKLAIAMVKVVDEAKANDPRALRAEIARLKKELEKSTGKLPEVVAGKTVTVEVPVVPAEWRTLVKSAMQAVAEAGAGVEQLAQAQAVRLHQAAKLLESSQGALPPMRELRSTPVLQHHLNPRPVLYKKPSSGTDGEVRIGQGEIKILTAVAQHPDGVTREQLTILTGYKRSTRDAYVQRLRQSGYVDNAGKITATKAGVEYLGPDFQPLPTGEALREYWMRELPKGERECLQVALDSYPDEVTRDAISDNTGFKRSTRDAYLQRLGVRRLIDTTHGGEVRAASELF